MTTQEQILEAQAKLIDLRKQRETEMALEFPIFIKEPYIFRKVVSRTWDLVVTETMLCNNHFADNGTVSCSGYDRIMSGECEIITREEFESARTETLKKLSEI
jgi:hypothetical protein